METNIDINFHCRKNRPKFYPITPKENQGKLLGKSQSFPYHILCITYKQPYQKLYQIKFN